MWVRRWQYDRIQERLQSLEDAYSESLDRIRSLEWEIETQESHYIGIPTWPGLKDRVRMIEEHLRFDRPTMIPSQPITWKVNIKPKRGA